MEVLCGVLWELWKSVFVIGWKLFTGVEKRVPSTRYSQSAHHSIDELPSLTFSSLSSRHPMQTMPPSGLCLSMRRLGGVMVLNKIMWVVLYKEKKSYFQTGCLIKQITYI